MQKLALALAALFALGLLFVLHEHAQNGRYQSSESGRFITDTRTGNVYAPDPQHPGAFYLTCELPKH
ncbi:hypothetical protein GCM10027594_28660 [Hymenobacter agri]